MVVLLRNKGFADSVDGVITGEFKRVHHNHNSLMIMGSNLGEATVKLEMKVPVAEDKEGNPKEEFIVSPLNGSVDDVFKISAIGTVSIEGLDDHRPVRVVLEGVTNATQNITIALD